MMYLFLFIFGLAVGSFLNVIIFRYQPGEKIFDPKIIGGPGYWDNHSHCLNCKKKLQWYELIPIISFLIQKGKCRGCSVKLSFQYPLVEILTGLIFVFVPMSFALSLPLLHLPSSISLFIILSAIWIAIFFFFILLFAIDLKYFIIPDSINFILAVLGVILISVNNFYGKFSLTTGSFLKHYAAIFGLRDSIWLNHLFAAVLGMLFFGLIIFLSRGRAMGGGDFKLASVLGLIFGWPDIFMVLCLSFVIGASISLILMIKGKKKIKDAVPFGPFLVIGASLVFFFGYQIINLYFQLFNI